MQPACEVYAGAELLASMTCSTWRAVGEITAHDNCYRLERGRMLLPTREEVATYTFNKGFGVFTRVVLIERATNRKFELCQKWIWRGTLVLRESGSPVAEYVPNFFQTKYRVTSLADIPQEIALLSIWLAAVASVFNNG